MEGLFYSSIQGHPYYFCWMSQKVPGASEILFPLEGNLWTATRASLSRLIWKELVCLALEAIEERELYIYILSQTLNYIPSIVFPPIVSSKYVDVFLKRYFSPFQSLLAFIEIPVRCNILLRWSTIKSKSSSAKAHSGQFIWSATNRDNSLPIKGSRLILFKSKLPNKKSISCGSSDTPVLFMSMNITFRAKSNSCISSWNIARAVTFPNFSKKRRPSSPRGSFRTYNKLYQLLWQWALKESCIVIWSPKISCWLNKVPSR